MRKMRKKYFHGAINAYLWTYYVMHYTTQDARVNAPLG